MRYLKNVKNIVSRVTRKVLKIWIEKDIFRNVFKICVSSSLPYMYICMYMYIYVCVCVYIYIYIYIYIRSEFIHWALWRTLMRTEYFLFVYHTTSILAKLSTWCFEHSGDISCALLVNPSHTDESWEGRNTCMWIYKDIHVDMYIYIYICVYMHICIYMYMYI